MFSQGLTWSRTALVAAVAAAAVVVAAGPAGASGGCSGSSIVINSNPGAEPPSTARGHRHATGNHYIRSIRNVGDGQVFTWWADNNGGLDGDTADSFHVSTFCP